jgi:hypothetical protein
VSTPVSNPCTVLECLTTLLFWLSTANGTDISYEISSLSDTQPFWFQIFLIVNQSDTEPPSDISNVNDIETNTQSIRFFIFDLISNWNKSFRSRQKLEQKGTFLFAPGKIRTKRNISLCSRMKLERKGTFIFALGKCGMKSNKSFCLNLFWYRTGTYIFAPGRKWNKRNISFSFRQKLERNVLLCSLEPKAEWKGTFIFAPEHGTKSNKYISFHLRTNQPSPRSPTPPNSFNISVGTKDIAWILYFWYW